MLVSGYSTALFSTWFHLPEWDLLFDCGDGVTSQLLLKGGGIKHIFISHADRDHIGGLFQFLQLNARKGLPNIYYPADSGSFPALRDFLAKFDPHTSESTWHPLLPGENVEIKPGITVRALANSHVNVPENQVKSLSYIVEKQTSKIREEFRTLPSHEIIALRTSKSEGELFELHTQKLLGFSGDTPSNDLSHWKGTRTLIHEATFLEFDKVTARGNHHSSLDQVLAQIPALQIEELILTHFSARYSSHEIREAIKAGIERNAILSKIYAVLPGETLFDVLGQDSIQG